MLKTYFNKAASLFFILGFLFIPLNFYKLGFQLSATRFFFFKAVAFIQHHLFGHALNNIDFSSDTIGLNVMLSLLLIIAFITILLLNVSNIKTSGIFNFFQFFSAYYVAAIFLQYGFDKIFKLQFYLPEPNILYSNFGNLNKDILFWSTMGLSRSYSIATGTVEIFTAILILFKRTRILGFCLSIGVLLNITLINLSFDISVKTFTCFLLAVVIFNVYPALKNIYIFFVQNRPAALSKGYESPKPSAKWINPVLSTCLIFYVLLPYLLAGNFNDDKAQRPVLHGAYSIERFIIGNDTLNRCDLPYIRFFIHRNNYIIFELKDNRMVDYFFEIDPSKRQLTVFDYKKNKTAITYSIIEKTGVLQLKFRNSKNWIVEGKPLNWRSLPAMHNTMHLTIDEIN